jgi:flagellar motor switch protein FliN
MTTFLDCWISVAGGLLPQAVAGEPELVESLPKPLEAGSFGFAATVGGEQQGRFSMLLDAALLDSPLLGEGMDQRAAWTELLREVCEAAAAEWLSKTGRPCRVEKFEPAEGISNASRVFELRSSGRAWTILVRDEVRDEVRGEARGLRQPGRPVAGEHASGPGIKAPDQPRLAETRPGVELLLDVELEATLRFGCREMPLGEVLELGPGDVVQLDRHVSDPVDLIVGDKIVARGEVVLVNGNFGLRVTEVAEPRKRLESIRCLF